MPRSLKIVTALWLLLLAGCATQKPVPPVSPPRLPPPPAAITTPAQTDFLCLTEKFLYGSEQQRMKLLGDLRSVEPTSIPCEGWRTLTR